MNQKWTRAICTVLTSALVFTGPAVEGTTFSGCQDTEAEGCREEEVTG